MKLVWFIAVILILTSCKKETATLTMMKAGETEEVVSNGFVSIMEGSVFTPETRRIDLNKDGIPDIEIVSEWIAYNSSLSPSVSLETLHDGITIRSKKLKETYYQFESNDFQITSEGKYEYFSTTRISCNQESSLYFPIESIEKTIIDPLLKGENFGFADNYSNGKFYLAQPDSGAYETMSVQDTNFYSFLEVQNDCGLFPQNHVRYVCFKLNTSQGVRLGWIELNYLGDNRLRLRDWVIQQ